jgi:nicotinate-nucleotide adenylyltransferase
MIGILGGTFDPIHFGHLRTALEVCEALGLGQLRLIPLRDPPHRAPPQTSPAQRLAMLRAAVAGEPRFLVDDRELQRHGKSYTLYTLQSLREEYPQRPICLLLGGDAFGGFPAWHRPEAILELCHLVVMGRPGEAPPDLYPQRVVTAPAELRQTPGGRILFQPVTQLAISATAIRALVRAGRSPRFLLPEGVLAIIHREGLYRDSPPSSQ